MALLCPEPFVSRVSFCRPHGKAVEDAGFALLAGVCGGHKRGVWAVAFSDADKSVATAGGDKIIRLWDCSNTTGSDLPCLKSFESHSGAVLAVKFLSSGQQLALVRRR